MKAFFDGEDLSKIYQQHNIWVVHKVMNTTYWVSALDTSMTCEHIGALGEVKTPYLWDVNNRPVKALKGRS